MRVFRTLVLGTTIACSDTLPPEGQVVLVMDTDAPAGLFDRVKVDIFPPTGSEPCVGCSREIPFDAAKVAALEFSFGFVPPKRDLGWRVRLRLFRGAGRATPRRASTIELVGYFPAVAEDGVVTLTATFRTDDLGNPRGSLEAPILFDRDRPGKSAIGTWPEAKVVACSGERAGAVCVPGGASWMGDPRVTIGSDFRGGATEHLVVLAPFFLDAREVTVKEMRDSGLAVVDSRGRAIDPTDDERDDIAGACDYTTAAGPWDDRALNCVSYALARRYCQAKGGDLPTEAELEVVASLRGTSLTPWGDREPTCSEAAVARDVLETAGGCATEQSGLFSRTVPDPPARGSLDRVVLEGGEIFDLGANVAEWARDDFESDAGECWAPALLRNPQCRSGPADRSVKLGDWKTRPVDPAQLRKGLGDFQVPEVGFRCAYPSK